MSLGRILVCAPRLPEYDRQCGSRRTFDLIELCEQLGWEPTFVAPDGSRGERYVRMLQQRGIPTYVADETQVKEVIERGRFDLALLTFWRIAEAFLPVIRRVSPSTFIIVDSIDLHFVRGARQVLRRERQTAPPVLLTDDYGRELVREINSYVAADAVLAVSTKERDLINDLTSDPRLAHCVPLCEDLEESTVPLETRKGIIFIGNFWHRPNVEAIEHLCYQIRPRLPEAVLAEHPIQIIGNGVNETVRQLGRLPHVLVVGWVPSIAPYLGRARMSVVPLLHGAGTKGKVLQALMAGTPTVSTPMGQEGLDLVDDRDILIADTADVFAKSIVRLAADDDLWRRLAHSGRSQIAAVHSREAIRNRLSEVFRTVLAKSPKAAPVSRRPEAQLIDRLRDVISRAVPANATLVVVSKGDEALLDLGVRQSWHFPRTSSGGYAGHYPADSEAAIAHLEDLRAQGGTHLLFPQTALWWLDHYRGLRQHLARHYQEEFLGDDLGLLYSLERSSTVPTTVVSSAGEEIVPSSKVSARTVQTAWDDTTIARLRPTVAHASPLSDSLPDPIRNVLVLGVYLANQKNNVSDIVNVLSSATSRITQRWIALGGAPPSPSVANVTSRVVLEKTPKFQLINELLSEVPLESFDYLMLIDDDVVLPADFVDSFIRLQAHVGFALAQPARTRNSPCDHPIVRAQLGVLARRTLFVEIGPVVSVHSSAFGELIPFDVASPMGWGYENVWAHRFAERGLAMGIIDAVPVDHSVRAVTANYAWAVADAGRAALFEKEAHLSDDECFRILELIDADGRRWDGRVSPAPAR